MPIGIALGTAAATAGASMYGANQQAGAARDAAKASKKATDASIQLQRDIYNQNRADQEPWRVAGASALGRLSDPASVMANFQASPDYNFRLQQGNQGVVQNAAVNGLLNSGAALKALTKFNSNIASNEFGDWWNRQAGLAGVGQAANAANAASGANYAGSAQNALMANAATQGQSSYNAANAMTQGVAGAAGAFTYGLGNLPWGAQNPMANPYGGGGKSTVPGWVN